MVCGQINLDIIATRPFASLFHLIPFICCDFQSRVTAQWGIFAGLITLLLNLNTDFYEISVRLSLAYYQTS